MARHYSTTSFFRQIPNALLARYFTERVLFGDVDFSALKETKPDALFEAWLALSEDQRKPMDAEFSWRKHPPGCRGRRRLLPESIWPLSIADENQ